MSSDLQPVLFTLDDHSTGVAELFPAVWGAAEGLTDPDAHVRLESLERLQALDAPRLSPIAACLIAGLLTDPDLQVRKLAVKIIGDLLAVDEQGRAAAERVKRHLKYSLAQMRKRTVYALLQCAEADAALEKPIARIFNACPYAGNHLMEILEERKMPLEIRRKAVQFIGLVGYLEAVPALQRLTARLEARQNGQQRMPFAPADGPDEAALLPEIHTALQILNAP